MSFLNKNVLIISPQKWEGMKVSKHHYATALSKHGLDVYFLEPPTSRGKFSTRKEDRLNIISFSIPFFIKKIKNKLSWLYRVVLHARLRNMLRKIPEIAIVVNFDNGIFYRNDFKFSLRSFSFNDFKSISFVGLISLTEKFIILNKYFFVSS